MPTTTRTDNGRLTHNLSPTFRAVLIGVENNQGTYGLERKTSINGRWTPVGVTNFMGLAELNAHYFSD